MTAKKLDVFKVLCRACNSTVGAALPSLSQEGRAIEDMIESSYQKGYQEGYKAARELEQKELKANKNLEEVAAEIVAQFAQVELPQEALDSLAKLWEEFFETGFKRLCLLCPMNLEAIVRGMCELVRFKGINGSLKLELSPEAYASVNSNTFADLGIELISNSDFKEGQCKLYCSKAAVEYDRGVMEQELEKILSTAEFKNI